MHAPAHQVIDVAEARRLALLGVVQAAAPVDGNVVRAVVELDGALDAGPRIQLAEPARGAGGQLRWAVTGMQAGAPPCTCMHMFTCPLPSTPHPTPPSSRSDPDPTHLNMLSKMGQSSLMLWRLSASWNFPTLSGVTCSAGQGSAVRRQAGRLTTTGCRTGQPLGHVAPHRTTSTRTTFGFLALLASHARASAQATVLVSRTRHASSNASSMRCPVCACMEGAGVPPPLRSPQWLRGKCARRPHHPPLRGTRRSPQSGTAPAQRDGPCAAAACMHARMHA
jgi:hypothetical protein